MEVSQTTPDICGSAEGRRQKNALPTSIGAGQLGRPTLQTPMASQPTPDTNRILWRLGRLVALDTQNPPGRNYRAMARLLAAELEPLGFKVSLHEPPMELQRRHVPDADAFPRVNLVARLDAGAKRTLHFNAHFDVVPASAAGWTSSPFELREQGPWVYGRGTADMKGAIVAILEAAHLLKTSGARPACNLEISFVCDEETGSELGAAWLVRSGIVKPDFAIVGEGGSGRKVCVGHNGTIWFEVTVIGKSAHGSMPEKGVNAFEGACALVAGLRKHRDALGRVRYRAPDGTVMHATLNLGGVASTGEGAKINTVPNEFRFTIDRRVLVSEDFDVARQRLEDCMAKVKEATPGLRYKLKALEGNRPCLVDTSASLVAAVEAAVAQERRLRVRRSVSTGFNDMHWFARDAGIPVVGYGPGGERFHGVDERARLKDIAETSKVYLRLMQTPLE